MATESVTVRRIPWTLPRGLRGLLALISLAGAVALLAVGWMQTGSTLAVVVNGQRQQVRTHATTVGSALRQVGLALYPEDWVWPAPDTPLQPGMAVQVQRARAAILSVDGQDRLLRTQAATAGGLLAEAGVRIGPGDEIWLDGRLVRPEAVLPAAAGEPPLVALRRAAVLTLADGRDGGQITTLHTTAPTVGQVLLEQGVQLFLGDLVTPGLQARVLPGMAVTIQRSIPVQIGVDGHLVRTRTRATTVAGVLGQEGIALVGKDRVVPDLSEPVQAGMTVRVTRVQEEYAVEFDPIPFVMVWVSDPQLEIDQTRLVQEGQVGLNKRRYRVVYEDGQEVERFLEDAWAEQGPITKTLAYGSKIVVRTLDTPDGPIEYWRKMRVYTTSYKPSSCGKPPDHPRYGYTRLGLKLKKGIVAVDPTVIPLRTRLYVPGYGLAFAGDTGGGVKGKFVDLGFDDHDYQSWHWWTDVYILTPVPPASQIRWTLPDWPRFPDRRR